MQDNKVTLQEIKDIMAQFVSERDWGQFHNPKSIVMALSVEVAELMERFSWPSTEESWQTLATYRDHIEEEVSDVLSLVCAFANACNIDLSTAFEKKMKINRHKYPVEKARGKHDRYSM